MKKRHWFFRCLPFGLGLVLLASQVQASAYLICEGKGFLTVDEDPWLVKDAYRMKEEFSHEFEVFFDQNSIKFLSDRFADREMFVGWSHVDGVTENYIPRQEELYYGFSEEIGYMSKIDESLHINRRDGAFSFIKRHFLSDTPDGRNKTFWWEEKYGANLDAGHFLEGRCRAKKTLF